MIAVVGMGRSGLGVARLLGARGEEVWATDSQNAPPLAGDFTRLGIPFETGGHDERRLLDAREIVVSPGVNPWIAPLARAREAGVPIVSELEVACRYLEGEIVAITGSNGKTTTTTLVGHILARGSRPVEVGGNIGRAVSDMVGVSGPETINVLEVSSFQLEGIDLFRPGIGVLLNVTPDHMDRYADFRAYRAAKFRLFQNQESGDTAILNRDDPETCPPPSGLAGEQRLFSLQPMERGGGFADGMLTVDGEPVVAVGAVALRGAHNLENVLAALLVADSHRIEPGRVREAVASFRPVEHRLEPVATVDGVEFVNDSKATNVDSALRAIESFETRIVLIAGGLDKGASFERLAAALAPRVRQVVTIGRAARLIEDAIAGRVPVERARNMGEAVAIASAASRPGDVVLLAPACASFDMFANYEERGREFRKAVRALLERSGAPGPQGTRDGRVPRYE